MKKKHRNFKDRTGEIFTSNEGCKIEIVEYFRSNNITVLLDDKTLIKEVQFADIIRGNIKNPYHKSVYGVGYLGEGEYKPTKNKKSTLCGETWRGMLKRSYSENSFIRNKAYKGCSVVEEWHNFQIFAQWFEDNYNPEYMKDWQLDKDILVKDNKIYSPETCCFVPHEINKLFSKSGKKDKVEPTGVLFYKRLSKYLASICMNSEHKHIGYFLTIEEAFEAYKTEKEKYIKEVADKWKDLIDPKVYEAMYNWKIEITD